MYTLYDYITHIKGVEYIISVMFIAGYILFAEVLKPRPFATVVNSGREDMEFIRRTGYRNVLKTVGKIAAAPFIGIAYVVALPFAFFGAIGSAAAGAALNAFGKTAVFGWRPTEAYLTGKKKKEESKKAGEK
jgi:hypothetical protein